MPKRPRDPNQLAKLVVDIAIGEAEDTASGAKRRSKGRAGGIKGGRVRAKRLTPKKRAEIARLAAAARWKKN